MNSSKIIIGNHFSKDYMTQFRNLHIYLEITVILGQRRQWQPTPVFLPGESQGQRRLVGCHLWGRTESDSTEAT